MKEINIVIKINNENGDSLTLPVKHSELPVIIRSKFGIDDKFTNFKIVSVDTIFENLVLEKTSIYDLNLLACKLNQVNTELLDKILVLCGRMDLKNPIEIMNIIMQSNQIDFAYDNSSILRQLNLEKYNREDIIESLQFYDKFYVESRYEELIEGNSNNIDGVIGNSDKEFSLDRLNYYETQIIYKDKTKNEKNELDVLEKE